MLYAKAVPLACKYLQLSCKVLKYSVLKFEKMSGLKRIACVLAKHTVPVPINKKDELPCSAYIASFCSGRDAPNPTLSNLLEERLQ